MKVIEWNAFLESLDGQHKELYVKKFLYLLKYNQEIGKTKLFDRIGFPEWTTVQNTFGYDAYPIVDKLFNIVFVMPGPHTMWKANLFAYKNKLPVPSSSDFDLMSWNFLLSKQGYYLSSARCKWYILDSFERDMYDDEILRTSNIRTFASVEKFALI
jgi:hypothetical protein